MVRNDYYICLTLNFIIVHCGLFVIITLTFLWPELNIQQNKYININIIYWGPLIEPYSADNPLLNSISNLVMAATQMHHLIIRVNSLKNFFRQLINPDTPLVEKSLFVS